MLELSQQVSQQHTSPFREAFLKRLIRGEIDNEQEIIQSASFLSTSCIPNIVFLIQGYIDGANKKAVPHDASSSITTVFRQHFAEKASLSFYILNAIYYFSCEFLLTTTLSNIGLRVKPVY